MSDFLVILGMHRSGTSALTGVFSRLGFYAGQSLMPANEYNQRGYYEDQPISTLLDELYASFGMRWYFEGAMPEGWSGCEQAVSYEGKLTALMADQYRLGAASVIKNPRLCRLLPIMKNVWRSCGLHPKYVFSLRSPTAVVGSLMRRDGLSSERGALLYLAHMLEAELHTRGEIRAFVDYEELLNDWRYSLGKAQEECDIDFLKKPIIDEYCELEINSFLTHELNHAPQYAIEKPGLALELATEAYLLLKKPKNTATLAAIDALRERYHNYVESLEPWLSDSHNLAKFKEGLKSAVLDGNSEVRNMVVLTAQSDIYISSVVQDFTEELKFSASCRFGEPNEHLVVIPVIKEKLKALRWDITDCPAFCLVCSVRLENLQGDVRWEWSHISPLFESTSLDMHVLGLDTENRLQIISRGLDPYGVLFIPEEITNEICTGWAFRVKFILDLPSKGFNVVMHKYEEAIKKLTEFDTSQRRSISTIGTLQREAMTKDQRIDQLQAQLKTMRNEILRAETQLELLKYLWTSDDRAESL